MLDNRIIFTKIDIPSWNNWSFFWLDFDAFFVALDEGNEPFDGPLKFTLDGAFPDGCHAVAQQRKFPVGLDVAYYVVRKLVVPEGTVALGAACELAAMLVPEATIYKHDHIVL